MAANQPSKSGSGLKIFGILLMVAAALFLFAAGDPEENFGAALLCTVMFILGLLMHFRGRRHAARANIFDPKSSIDDVRPQVLYLRSFRTDTSTSFKALAVGLSSHEEQLADVLRPFGTLIAIGKPGEPLPLPGAARMYASDAEWKSIVLERMSVAPLIVIRASTSRGLLWEVEQAIQTLPPHKIVFFIMDMSMKDYHQFAARVREELGLALPAIPAFGLLQAVVDLRQNPSRAQSGFLYFPADWTPVFLPLPNTIVRLGYNDMRESFNVALRPVFELHGLPWQSLGRFHS
jgi:hypothetical protein